TLGVDALSGMALRPVPPICLPEPVGVPHPQQAEGAVGEGTTLDDLIHVALDVESVAAIALAAIAGIDLAHDIHVADHRDAVAPIVEGVGAIDRVHVTLHGDAVARVVLGAAVLHGFALAGERQSDAVAEPVHVAEVAAVTVDLPAGGAGAIRPVYIHH